ncbi:MAG: UTP--glucose-1-phosphate uridylyltransferase [Myxococcota bacterium]
MKIKTCVFPVAGLGKRFLPATKSIPKEMLVVVDKPLIQYAVEEARAAGFERFIFVTSQGKSAIEDHFDANLRLMQELERRGALAELEKLRDLSLEAGQAIYVRQPAPLGLGHAVLCARDLIEEDAFGVILADDLVLAEQPCMAQMVDAYEHADGNMVGVMEVQPDQTQHYGVLDFQEEGHGAKKIDARGIVEKPKTGTAPSRMAVVGRYILRRSTFDFLENQTADAGGEIQLTSALAAMIQSFGLTGFVYGGQRFDCGMKSGWMSANLAFGFRNPELRATLQKTWSELCASR